MKRKTRLTLEYWQDGRWYVGRLKEVPEVLSQGETLAALRENILDAYRLVLEDRPKIDRPTKSTSILVSA